MEILIGTSGWLYKDWAERFYPKKLKNNEKLPYLAEHFPTVEINSSFYRLPSKETFTLWHKRVPEKFLFSVKFPRFITQMKKLGLDENSKGYGHDFITNSANLKEHLGAVLVQLPPNFGCNYERLEIFITWLKKQYLRRKYRPDLFVEFRHATWFNGQVYALLRKNNIGFVISDSSVWPQEKIFTADSSYIRFHGPGKLFASSYSEKELQKWAKFIVSQKKIKRFYIYFNNDLSAKAIDNAKFLQLSVNKLLTKQ
jgi:uncharacterized protein YecE (DUF72 family)